ncbi:hypothetical protein ACJZ2D_001705 [Fusarium nematophilum]
MLPAKGLVAAFLLLSGAQAGVPRLRLAARAVDTIATPEPETTTTRFPLPFESTTTAVTTSESIETTTEVSASTETTSEETTEDTATELQSTTTASTDTTEASATTTNASTDASTDVSTVSEASILTETSANVDTSATTDDASNVTDAPATTEAPTAAGASSTTDASITITAGANTESDTSAVVDVPTTTKAVLPTSFVSTGTGAFIGVPTAASNAGSSFTGLVGAASAIAANPTPSAEEVRQFQQQAQAEIDQLESIKDRLEHIDRSSLSEHDDEVVGAALVGLAALLGWFGTQMAALAPAVATPALAPAVDSCPLNQGQDEMVHVSTKVDCDAVSTRHGPLPTGAFDTVVNPVPQPEKRDLTPRVFEVDTSPNPDYITKLSGVPPAWVTQQGDATGVWYDFVQAGQGFAGVNGIYGCTAVIIVSDKGVYLSHIWENPVFIDADWNPTDDLSFYFNAIYPLIHGGGSATAITSLLNDQLHSLNSPRIYVLSPWATDWDMLTGINTPLRYQARAQQIADALADAIPGSTKDLLGYTRTNKDQSTENGYMGRTILEVDVEESFWITPDSWAFNVGKWRLWVEQYMVSSSSFIVASSGVDMNEFFDFDGASATDAPGNLEKRQEANHNDLIECLAHTRTTAEATSTTAGATATSTAAETTETASTSSGESIATTEQTSTGVSTASTNSEESTVTTDETATTESTASSTVESTSTAEPTGSSTVEFTSTAESTAEFTSTADFTTLTESIFSFSSTVTTFSTAIISSRSTDSEESTSTSTTSTRTKPNIRTVTQDGMICTLVEGSLHPVCRPISTPTPNPDGTNVHVNKGCILINGSPRCASDAGSISSHYESSYNVASSPDEPYSTVLILSGFDSSLDNHMHSKATCQLQARWPANYGDIYFGEDGCLYDSQSNKIFDQCCSPPDVNNSGPTTNPYCPPSPPDAHQDHGNHDGSAICASISKDTCLSAAQRYVDDVIYHQYTSAVWPDDTGKDIANAIFPIAGPIVEDFFGINYGCTVIWTCDNDDAFSRGMTGKQIKDSMLNIYNLNGAKGCGSTYLDNGCHITVNGCNNCRDYGHSQTLWHPVDVYQGTFDDANNGFPPRR